MQKCGYYPGIPGFNGRLAGFLWLFGRLFWILPPSNPSLGFFQVYPQNTRYFADFADFATKKALRLALISVRQLVSRTTF